MTDQTRFKIIFEKLAEEAKDSSTDAESLVKAVEDLREESDEIDELRRLSAELSDPEPTYYTLT